MPNLLDSIAEESAPGDALRCVRDWLERQGQPDAAALIHAETFLPGPEEWPAAEEAYERGYEKAAEGLEKEHEVGYAAGYAEGYYQRALEQTPAPV